MKNLIVAAAVLLGLLLVFGLMYGWVQYQHTSEKTTIEINTKQMSHDIEDAADNAVNAGKRALDSPK